MVKYSNSNFHFRVKWGNARMSFTEVTGIENSGEEIHYRQGTTTRYGKINTSGMQKSPNISLKRGIFNGDFSLWKDCISSEVKNMTITLFNEKHEPVVRWKIKNARPVKIESANMNAVGMK